MASIHFGPSPSSNLYQRSFSIDEVANRIASIPAEEIGAVAKALVRIALYNEGTESRSKALPDAVSRITDAFARPHDFIEKGVFIRCGNRTIQLSLRTAASLENADLQFAVADETRYLSYSLKSLVESGGT